MLDRYSVLGRRHVSLNSLFLPVEMAVQQARRCCVPLHVKTNDADWPISNMGSGVLYAYKHRSFCVFTRHQLGKFTRPAQVLVRLTGSETTLHSGARYIEFPRVPYGPEEHDLCAIELPWRISETQGPLFFRAESRKLQLAPEALLCFAIGYPSKLTKMEGEENSEGIAMSQVLVWASGASHRSGDIPKIDLLPGEIMGPKCAGDFDGFSGGPVFGISVEAQAILLCGVIVRGGRDKLFFVPTNWVDNLCEVALALPRIDHVAA